MSGLLLLPAAALALPTLLAMRMDEVGGRRALTILTSAPMTPAQVRREGDHLIVPLPAVVPPGFVAPGPQPPLEDIGFERGPSGFGLRLRLARTVPYTVRQNGSVLQIVFGNEASVPASSATAIPTATLYQSLFRATPDPAVANVEQQSAPAANEPAQGGFQIGPVRLEPAIAINYWEGDSALGDTPKPVRHRYLEIQPQLLGELTLLQGRLKLNYEPRIRGFSSFPAVNQWSHRAKMTLDQPFGTFLVHADHAITTGILETTEVDPGREYFFHLSGFRHRVTSASAALEPGGVVGFEVGATHETVHVDDRAAFFDHSAQAVRVALDYALAPERKVALGYVFDRVPTPSQRPEAGAHAHTVEARLYGEVFPLLRAEASAGYRQQSNPNAAEGGRQYRGSVFAARFLKDFTPGTALGVSLGRSTPVSNFEGNGFYVTTSAQGDASTTIPFGLIFRASAGRQRNVYRTVAAAIGRPREDRIDGWSVGLGRPLGRRAYLRVDYRAERRNSNLDEFDSNAHGLVFQFGLLASPRSP